MMNNSLTPVGYIGTERKPAFLKTQVVEFLNFEELEQWMNNSDIMIIDDEGSKLKIQSKQQNELETFHREWLLDINKLIFG